MSDKSVKQVKTTGKETKEVRKETTTATTVPRIHNYSRNMCLCLTSVCHKKS